MKMPTLKEKAASLGLAPGKVVGKASLKKRGAGDRIVISLKATSFGGQEAAERYDADIPLPQPFDCRYCLPLTLI